jgi:tRNA (guanine10-N2)-dimethyltransferase
MVHKSLFILGRQPAIGRAELESLFGSKQIEPIGDAAVATTLPLDEVDFNRIGGSVRLAKPLTELDTTRWPDIVRYLREQLPSHLDYLPEGKLKLGISTFGLAVNTKHLLATGLELKKICKKAGRAVRVVPNAETELNSAQVLHNNLTGELGMELLLIRNRNKTYLAQTIAVQNIEAYAKRDQARPKRDARVGMLPPKLAQIIVNLAASSLPPHEDHIVLDPFCGTGVVLQEALLMGYGAYGTDLEPRMIDYSRHNLQWLGTHGSLHDSQLEVGDATTHNWQHPFSMVASETYLGRPLSSWPGAETLQDIIGACNTVVSKFLTNLADQLPSKTRLCLAIPAWRGPGDKIHHLPLLDHLGQIGYNQVSFEHVRAHELVYYRPNQIVARELLVITRK